MEFKCGSCNYSVQDDRWNYVTISCLSCWGVTHKYTNYSLPLSAIKLLLASKWYQKYQALIIPLFGINKGHCTLIRIYHFILIESSNRTNPNSDGLMTADINVICILLLFLYTLDHGTSRSFIKTKKYYSNMHEEYLIKDIHYYSHLIGLNNKFHTPYNCINCYCVNYYQVKWTHWLLYVILA
jgi:hypothetical protein